MTVRYKQFRGTLALWDTLFRQAAEFAGQLPDGSLINIAHSCDHSDGVVTVWFRQAADEPMACLECSTPISATDRACPQCGWSWAGGG